ncbi:MAG: flagellar motor switch protein FliM [Planctomycetes bacterium]|nr:flagellar motor switch protein FliM [Planctomycetota bacterium]NOG54460.1 flagellar motor switch protein FliM [Planctomycetota bacterium]
MNEILDQADIDALLAAVDEGHIEEETTHGQLFTRQRRDLEQVEIRPYDFKRPERVSKEQMRSLETLHESFARVFGAALSGFMRTIVEIRVANAEQMTYAEFIASLPNPTAFTLVHCDGLEGTLCLEVSPLIVYPIIDRMLGGSNSELFIPQRPMTGIEFRLISVILERAMAALSEAWSGICQVQFKIGEMDSNPQLVQIVPPNEVVIVLGFEIKMTTRAGTMNLCIPFNVIEPLMDKLSAQNWFNVHPLKERDRYIEQVTANISNAALEASGILAETTITLDDLMSLAEGDLIMTDKPAARPVVLSVEGERKFLAHIGQHRGNRALRIIRPITHTDRV